MNVRRAAADVERPIEVARAPGTVKFRNRPPAGIT
jgi:hypothetical protein